MCQLVSYYELPGDRGTCDGLWQLSHYTGTLGTPAWGRNGPPHDVVLHYKNPKLKNVQGRRTAGQVVFAPDDFVVNIKSWPSFNKSSFCP
jgi:hypothetical protein